MATSSGKATGASGATGASTGNSLLDMERRFANDVGYATGLDPRVILAQAQQEGAYVPGGTGGLNFLNLRTGTVTSLGKTYASASPGGFAQFSSLQQAEAATIAEYQSPAIGLPPASEIGRLYSTPERQIALIANSPWDAGHYGGNGGVNLRNTFTGMFGTAALAAPAQHGSGGGLPGWIKNLPGSVANVVIGPKLPAGSGPQLLPSPGGAASGLASFLGLPAIPSNVLQRTGEVLAGGVLLAVAVIFLGLSVSRSAPAAAGRTVVRTVKR